MWFYLIFDLRGNQQITTNSVQRLCYSKIFSLILTNERGRRRKIAYLNIIYSFICIDHFCFFFSFGNDPRFAHSDRNHYDKQKQFWNYIECFMSMLKRKWKRIAIYNDKILVVMSWSKFWLYINSIEIYELLKQGEKPNRSGLFNHITDGYNQYITVTRVQRAAKSKIHNIIFKIVHKERKNQTSIN